VSAWGEWGQQEARWDFLNALAVQNKLPVSLVQNCFLMVVSLFFFSFITNYKLVVVERIFLCSHYSGCTCGPPPHGRNQLVVWRGKDVLMTIKTVIHGIWKHCVHFRNFGTSKWANKMVTRKREDGDFTSKSTSLFTTNHTLNISIGLPNIDGIQPRCQFKPLINVKVHLKVYQN
jgi:hypothetical protein